MSKRKAPTTVPEASGLGEHDEPKAAVNCVDDVVKPAPKKAKREDSVGEFSRWQYYENGGWNIYNKKASAFLQQSATNGDPLMVFEPTTTYKKKSSEKRIRCDDSNSKLVFFIVKDKFYKKAKELNKK